jgi:hypothetical protein
MSRLTGLSIFGMDDIFIYFCDSQATVGDAEVL